MKLIVIAVAGILAAGFNFLPIAQLQLEYIPNGNVYLNLVVICMFFLVMIEGLVGRGRPGEVDMLNNKLGVAEKSISDFETTIELQKNSFTSLERELESMHAALDTKTRELAKSKDVLETMGAELSSNRTALAEAQNRVEDLRKKMQTQQAASSDDVVVSFLGLLQEKARFVDFVMEDITPYSNEQVGGAARFLHQGCKELMKEYFDINPVRSEKEGEGIVIGSSEPSEKYKILGNISDELPYKGKLLHRGWQTSKVALPKSTRTGASGSRNVVIAPAEIQL